MGIIEVLNEAIESERRERDKYIKMAKEAPDPETRAVLEQLAGDEKEHERILRERLSAVKLMRDLRDV